jgi:hypothetical protein
MPVCRNSANFCSEQPACLPSNSNGDGKSIGGGVLERLHLIELDIARIVFTGCDSFGVCQSGSALRPVAKPLPDFIRATCKKSGLEHCDRRLSILHTRSSFAWARFQICSS